RRRHTRSKRDWSSDVCSSDLTNMKTNNLPFPASYWYYGSFYCNEQTASPQKRFTFEVKYPSQKIMVGCYAFARPKEATNFHGGRSEERRVGKECGWRWEWCSV